MYIYIDNYIYIDIDIYIYVHVCDVLMLHVYRYIHRLIVIYFYLTSHIQFNTIHILHNDLIKNISRQAMN